MLRHTLAHLSDGTLRRALQSLVAADCATTSKMLAHLAEFDHRRLYAGDGYPSMFAYCVQRLRFSEDMAFKRIRVARAGRLFPALLEAIGQGRLHLSGAVLLAPHLKPENADKLLAAANHRTKAGIERLLAEIFPQPDLPTIVRAIAAPTPPYAPVTEVAPGPPEPVFGSSEPAPSVASATPPPTLTRPELAPGPVAIPARPHRVAPVAPQRFALQVTIDQRTHDKLRRVQELLGHALPLGDLAQVLDRALDALLEKLEKAKCAATDRPRRSPRVSADPRHVPAHVKRQVWARDGGRCTFMSDAGQRCSARKFLEYDHVLEVARGGGASVGGIRLRCRTHNQLTAEHSFGSEFMRARREAARAGP